MKCNSCGRLIPDTSTTCPVCGADTGKDFFADVRQMGRNSRDELLLLLYISWVLFANILFLLINKFVIRRMFVSAAWRVGRFMSAFDILITSVDLVFMAAALILLKSRRAKGFFIAFLLIRVVLFALNRMIR